MSLPHYLENAVQIIAYNVSISDMGKKKKEAKVFRSISRASQFFNVHESVIRRCIIPVSKRRLTAIDGNIYAIRIKK